MKRYGLILSPFSANIRTRKKSIVKIGHLIAKSVLQLFQRALFEARYVGAGNSQVFCHLALSFRLIALQPVAQHDDLALARQEQRVHQTADALHVPLHIQIRLYALVGADYIKICKRISVLVDVYGVVDGYLARGLFLASEEHQNFVRYPHLTARS